MKVLAAVLILTIGLVTHTNAQDFKPKLAGKTWYFVAKKCDGDTKKMANEGGQCYFMLLKLNADGTFVSGTQSGKFDVAGNKLVLHFSANLQGVYIIETCDGDFLKIKETKASDNCEYHAIAIPNK